MTKLPHFIPYQGSKRNLAKHILRFFPKDFHRLVEPFAGTAAISVATCANRSVQKFWLNDLNQPLTNLLKFAIEQPEDLANSYLEVWNEQYPNSLEHYFEVRSQFNQTQDPNLLLYLLARCVKSSVRYNSEGGFNQSPDKRRKGTNPATMQKNILGVSNLLRGKCKFTSLDYREVLDQIEAGDFIYMDPPYQGVCKNRDSRYLSGIDFDQFVLAIQNLNQKGVAFAISYDGKLGDKAFGQILPHSLNLKRIEIVVGRSSQSTLLGKNETTVESLYLSPNLSTSLVTSLFHTVNYKTSTPKQLNLLEQHGQFSATTR